MATSNTALSHAIDALNEDFIRHHQTEAARAIAQLRVVDIAELLSRRAAPATLELWQQLPLDIAAATLTYLQPPLAMQLMHKADVVKIAQCLALLDEERRRQLLEPVAAPRRQEIEELMRFPPDSAGALMDIHVVVLPVSMTVREALASLRRRRQTARQIYLRDDEGKLVQIIETQNLAFADPVVTIGSVARPLRAAVLSTAQREEIVELIEKFKLTELPVIDIDGGVVGVIHHDALMRAVREESSEDLLTMVGVSSKERALSPIRFVVRKRLPWLQINLLTAFLAASVVGIFENTIARFTALAVLLPVVAGQSGNTGAQALAVTMRALALREISASHWWRVARKELGAGLINGTAVALTTALGVLVWSRSWGLALVIAISMVLAMVIAGFVGVVIPITLSKLGQDPAQSSSIILTTVTDVSGFFSFLGIATALSALL
jgi:magnesium transporter